MPATIQTLDSLIEASAATPEFKAALRELQRGGRSPLITLSHGSPTVKAARVLSKLLEVEPALAIREVSIKGASGCSDFEGTLTVNGGEHEYNFLWDCKWRADLEGWTDCFGFADQARAAREFGYQCFERFDRVR